MIPYCGGYAVDKQNQRSFTAEVSSANKTRDLSPQRAQRTAEETRNHVVWFPLRPSAPSVVKDLWFFVLLIPLR
jgi:hypothetical protein